MPFKLNHDRRQHIPRQRHRVVNSAAYDAVLRQRGSVTVWFTDKAIEDWRAEPRIMLQRSPTFYWTGRNAIEIADELRELGIDESWIHEVVRRKIQREQDIFTRRTFTKPEKVREELLANARAVDWAETITYRGMMFTEAPNLAWVFGYFRASWTLRADLVADVICRLLRHMREKGVRKVEVALRSEDVAMPILPWIDPDDFNPGYLVRDLHKLPKRGPKPEWQHTQDHWAEKDMFPAIDLDGPEFVYS